MTSVTLLHGDTLHLLTEPTDDGKRRAPTALRNPEGKILKADACITDPPYNVSLDGDREWDDFQCDRFSKPDEDFRQWTHDWLRPLMLEVLLPGALTTAFSAHRTVHAVVFGMQDAGFDIIDIGLWLYATGQVKHKQKLKPAYEPWVIGRRRSPEGDSVAGLNKLFKEKGRGLLHTQAVKEERHPINVEIADGRVIEIDDDIRDIAKFFYVAKPSASEIDYGCEHMELRRKEGNLGGETLHQTRDTDGNLVRGKHTLRRNFHPTVKPIELMRRMVRLLTKPGATVVDPFMGSGTTGIACVLEGRNFIGIEREADFLEIASHRIATALREVGNTAEADRLLARLAPPDERQAA